MGTKPFTSLNATLSRYVDIGIGQVAELVEFKRDQKMLVHAVPQSPTEL